MTIKEVAILDIQLATKRDGSLDDTLITKHEKLVDIASKLKDLLESLGYENDQHVLNIIECKCLFDGLQVSDPEDPEETYDAYYQWADYTSKLHKNLSAYIDKRKEYLSSQLKKR